MKDCIVEYTIFFPYNNQTYHSECFIVGEFSIEKLKLEIMKRFGCNVNIIEAYLSIPGKKIQVI